MDKILNGNYTIGHASWDTGYCQLCGLQLTHEERKQAATNMLITGFMYWCDICTEAFFRKNKGIYK